MVHSKSRVIRPWLLATLLACLALPACSTAPRPTDRAIIKTFRLYGKGQCPELLEYVARIDWTKDDRSREPVFDLMRGFCLERGGDLDQATAVYGSVVTRAPNTYEGYGAALRLAELRRVARGGPSRAQLAEIDLEAPPYTHGSGLVHQTPIQYPIGYMMAGVTGYTVVDFAVTPTGEVTDVMLVSSEPPYLFDSAALATIRHWVYQPNATGDPRRNRTKIRFQIKYEP